MIVFLIVCLLILFCLLAWIELNYFLQNRKRKRETDPGELIGEKVVYRIRRGWDKEAAQPIYYLQEALMWKWSRDEKYKLRTTYGPDDMLLHGRDGWMTVGSGDQSWAERHAEHYGITVEAGDGHS